MCCSCSGCLLSVHLRAFPALLWSHFSFLFLFFCFLFLIFGLYFDADCVSNLCDGNTGLCVPCSTSLDCPPVHFCFSGTCTGMYVYAVCVSGCLRMYVYAVCCMRMRVSMYVLSYVRVCMRVLVSCCMCVRVFNSNTHTQHALLATDTSVQPAATVCTTTPRVLAATATTTTRAAAPRRPTARLRNTARSTPRLATALAFVSFLFIFSFLFLCLFYSADVLNFVSVCTCARFYLHVCLRVHVCSQKRVRHALHSRQPMQQRLLCGRA